MFCSVCGIYCEERETLCPACKYDEQEQQALTIEEGGKDEMQNLL